MATKILLSVIIIMVVISCDNNPNYIGYYLDEIDRNSACNDQMIIVTSKEKIQEMLSGFFEDKFFYTEGRDAHYVFDIYLNNSLRINEVNIRFANNKELATKMAAIFNKLEYKKISQDKNCKLYLVRFVIKARNKGILYPDSEAFLRDLLQ